MAAISSPPSACGSRQPSAKGSGPGATGGQPVFGRVLAHRRHADPVAQGYAAHRQGLQQMRHVARIIARNPSLRASPNRHPTISWGGARLWCFAMDTANPDDLLSRRTDHLKIVKQPADGAHVESEPRLFLNRELSWLAFNERVLEEARDPSLPLYERLKFIGIVSSTFDEFFMIRVGGLT